MKGIFEKYNPDRKSKEIIFYTKSLNYKYRLKFIKKNLIFHLPRIDNYENHYIINQCRFYLSRNIDYENKHLYQESSIIYNLSKLVKNKINALVIDIGGGNGCLGYLISKILDIKTLVIDKIKPKNCVENFKNDLDKFTRIIDNFENIDLSIYKDFDIFIVCKHLCGTELDIVINQMIKNKNILKGCILVPCCYSKSHYENFEWIDPITFKSINNIKITKNDFNTLIKSTDYKANKMLGTPYFDIGLISELIINNIRINILEKFVFQNIDFIEYALLKRTNRNLMIIGSNFL